MKKSLLALTFFIVSLFVQAQLPTLDWAKRQGGAFDEVCTSIAVDADGNVYNTGYFNDSADMDPGTLRKSILAAGASDIFISKLDDKGKYVWAKRIGGSGNDIGYSIALDGTGNLYVTGGFTGSVDFDPGTGVKTLTASGTLMDIFVAKFDPNGSLMWAVSIGGSLQDYGSSIAVDANNNVYTTGFFYSTVDFDPDNASTINLSSKGNSDIFVLKLDGTGKFGWAKGIGSPSADAGRSIALDASSNVYTTGSFSGSADFDPGLTEFLLTSNGSSDIFISKLDGNGNFVWAKNVGGTSDEEGSAIAVTGTGIAHITGRFGGTADFDPSANTFNLTAVGDKDVFILKLNATGNLGWVKQLGGLVGDFGFGIALDATGNVYTTGSFKGMADFDPGSGVNELTSSGLDDIFISKLDVSGNFVSAKKMGSTLSEVGQSIVLGKSGAFYVAGFFAGTVDFDPDAPTLDLVSEGNSDVFMQKFSVKSGSIQLPFESSILMFPNPSKTVINFTFYNINTQAIHYTIANSVGQVLDTNPLIQNQINVEHLPTGIYYIELLNEGALISTKKLIISDY